MRTQSDLPHALRGHRVISVTSALCVLRICRENGTHAYRCITHTFSTLLTGIEYFFLLSAYSFQDTRFNPCFFLFLRLFLSRIPVLTLACRIQPPFPLPDIPGSAESDWWRTGAYLGISATTGDLADNHDALSLLVTAEGACVRAPMCRGWLILCA